MKKIAIVGEAMLELNGQPFTELRQTYGGDTINTAVYAARLLQIRGCNNVRVDYLTAVGTDHVSTRLVALWQQEGLGTELVLHDAARIPGVYMIQLDADGERSFLYWRGESAARYLLQHREFKNVEARLSAYDLIYLSGISLAILPDEDRLRCLDLLQRRVKSGVKLYFDSNYRPRLWHSVDYAREACKAVYEIAEVVLATEDDEVALWEQPGATPTSEAIIQRIHAHGAATVVLKRGKHGCILSSGQHTTSIPAASITNVVDTTAAGDSFNAGFIAGIACGGTFEDACRAGNQLAGIVIQHKGAIISREAMAFN